MYSNQSTVPVSSPEMNSRVLVRNTGCTEPFLDLSVSGNNFALLSEVVIPFFGNVFFQSFELLLPLAEGLFFSP